MRIRVTGVVLSCAVIAFTAPVHADIQVVAVSDQLSPDGQPFGGIFMPPAINANGRLLIASAAKDTFHSRLGIWTGTPGQLTTVVRPNDPVPGMSETFEFIYDSNIDDAGRVMLVTTTGSHYPGLWHGSPGNLQTLAYLGTVLPELVVNGTGNGANLSRNGTAAFTVYGDPYSAILRGAPENLGFVARSDRLPPGMTAGSFSNFDNSDPRIDSTGQVVFSTTAVRPGGETFQGVWSTANGALSLVALEGQQATGLGIADGVTFTDFTNPTIANGAIAFRASLQGPGVSASNDAGIWVGPYNVRNLFAREGDLIPGTPVMLGEPDSPVVNRYQVVAFTSTITGPAVDSSNDRGVFIASGHGLRLIAREGAVAPGTGGALFTSFDEPSINEHGQLAFLATLSGDQDAIFATDASGALLLLAREGMTLDLGDGQPGTIASLGLIAGSNAGEDGSRSGFNHLGQVAFRAVFEDSRSAILVATVPEPSVIAIVAGAAGGLLALRRRSRRDFSRSA